MTAIESTIREMSANIFDMAIGVEMAEPVATFQLHKLLNMVTPEQAEAIKVGLPIAAEFAMDAAMARYDKRHA